MSRQAVSVVVPFFGDPASAEAMLSTLTALELSPGDELIAADNTPGGIVVERDSTRVVRVRERRSAYHARNAAAAVASAPWLLFTDADRELPPDLLDRLLAAGPGADTAILAGEVAIDLGHIDQVEFPPLSRSILEARTRDTGFELGRGFRIAAEALGSTVERVTCNVYELEPGRIGGPVDLAFNGATLTHLRDPVGALERIRDVLVPGGRLISYEPISVRLSLRSPRRPAGEFRAHNSEYSWWVPNIAAAGAWIRAAGFEQIRRIAITRPPSLEERDAYYAAFGARRSRD